ncbi:MAG: phosphate ABC transporter substrate-binding/OmpA family protein [Sandaracinaceae bacterium]
MAEAKLTPFAKVLIALVILGATAAAAWHLGVKDMFTGDGGDTTTTTTTDGEDGTTGTTGSGTSTSASGPLGSAGNPLKVSIVSFHGYAPALLANGNSLTTQPNSIMANAGAHVEFVIQDDIPTLATIFESGAAHCAWRTSDFWAQEQPNLRNNSLDARAIMVVDNTQGADAVIARDPSVRRIEDLVGKRVALLQFTPSHGMIIDAVENSSLTARERTQIDYVFINADEGTAGVRAAFAGGQVDAAVLWDPDLSLAVNAVDGAHVIYSTRIATNLIYDVIVCDSRVLTDANHATIQGFVQGWMEGVTAARADHDRALQALTATEPFFQQLAREEGESFVKGLFDNLVWTGLEDNVRILGLAGGTNHYERVYSRFDRIYRGLGALANPNAPVITPAQSIDTSFISALMQAQPEVREEAQAPEFTFTEQERVAVQEEAPVVTRPVIVVFQSGSAELNRRAQQQIDQEMVPMIENHGSAYFTVSGNTDSTGTRAANLRISRDRATAVVDYLVSQWNFPRERFNIVGNGPDQPLCDERNPPEGESLEDCQARNRTTRLAVLAREQADGTPAGQHP